VSRSTGGCPAHRERSYTCGSRRMCAGRAAAGAAVAGALRRAVVDDEVLGLPACVPLFPLPGVVLFPGTIIPLHIFEPRYRAMVADALAGERYVAIALLKPGWEPLYHTSRAPIHPTVGVGRILEHEQTDDGNYNILLRGVGRARIVEELREHLYRVARIEAIETRCTADEATSETLREELFDAIRGNPGLDPGLRRQWLRLRDTDLDLGTLSDLLAAGVPAEAELRQCLLEEADAAARTRMLVEQIRTVAAIARNVPRVGPPRRQSLN